MSPIPSERSPDSALTRQSPTSTESRNLKVMTVKTREKALRRMSNFSRELFRMSQISSENNKAMPLGFATGGPTPLRSPKTQELSRYGWHCMKNLNVTNQARMNVCESERQKSSLCSNAATIRSRILCPLAAIST